MWFVKICVSFLLVLAFPTTGAIPVGSSVNENREVAERYDSSPVLATDGALMTSLLRLFYIPEDMQNTYLPLVLHLTGVVQTFMGLEPSSYSDFLELAKQPEQSWQTYLRRLLADAAGSSESAKIADVVSAVNYIAELTVSFRDDIKGVLDDHYDLLTTELESIFAKMVNDLETPVSEKAPRRVKRAEIADGSIDDTAQALVKLATRYGIEEEVVTTYLFTLKPQVQALRVAIGDIKRKHPQLFHVLASSVAALLIPESWILRPLLLSVFGYGPAATKGSAVALTQTHFEGAAVEAGSWLQAAGMGEWAWLVTGLPLLIGILWAKWHPRRTRW